jgi:peroxiredoxin
MPKPLIALAALVAALCLGLAPAATAAQPKVDQPAPDFRVTTLDGQAIQLSDLRGQVVVLNFWATWCGPCKIELPLLDAYYRVQRRHGLVVLAVTTQDSLPLSDLKPLAKVLTIPMVRHFQGPYAPIGGAVPTNFVIDRNGVLRYAQAGAFDLDALNDVLVPLLQAPPPEAAPAAIRPPAT